MIARIPSAGLFGIEARPVTVEVDVARGLPGWHLVGLPEAMVRESKERVAAALRNAGFQMPACKITINLSPARERKSGTWFDLPIALGLLEANGLLPPGCADAWICIGELSLAGTLQPVPGAFSAALLARRKGCGLMHPIGNTAGLAMMPALPRLGAGSLADIVTYFLEGTAPPARKLPPLRPDPSSVDLEEVKGQAIGRRALEIAAAGGHHCFFLGPPGTGKTMLAERLPTILPPLTEEEAIETVQIYSAMDEPEATWPVHTRPFRAPHHSASAASMAGGGRTIQAGEITLAHNGVLFLDELGEFPRDVLQVLRQPLESGVIHIARADYRYRFPARFALVAASNPCRCGNFGHPMAACRCSLQHIQQYRQKLSGPLMDRMDLHVELGWMSPETTMETAPGESSAAVRARVLAARARQVQRARGRGPLVNAALGPRLLKEWCAPTAEARQLLTSAITRHGFSARAHDRILRVARTIADLAGEDRIAAPQMAEAIQFRALDRPL